MTEARPDATGPLGHLRVLDLSRVLAGPWAGQALADLGATVLKVERPVDGDDTRAWGPPWLTDADGEVVTSAYFLAANRGKRSVTIDLAHPDGQALVHALAATCDVVLENYKPGTLARWGLDAASLRARHPRLVVCTITGFDPDGPDGHRPGYDLLVQAMGGLMSLTGAPDGPPTKVGVAVADLMTGMYAVTGVLAALLRREHTGVGEHVQLALHDTQLAWLANQGLNALVTGEAPRRLGSAHPSIVPYQAFEAADGHLVVAVGNDTQFRALCRAIDAPSWVDDPRFATNAARVAHRDVLVPALAARLRVLPRADWEARLTAVGVPCGPVLDACEALARAGVADRVVRHQQDGDTVIPGLANPLRFDGTPAVAGRPPPRLGADTDAVVAEVWGPEAVARVRASGAVGPS
ncbi:MAG: CoA transferase [Alphaproteobacteria bacterium]|nr:CoA transferase [Alphaproteobacteria bacterium]